MPADPRRLNRPFVDASMPCPCGSGQRAAACCLNAGGTVRKYVPSVRPRPPKTGQSQNGCYLGHTQECGGSISGEHYISEVVLEQLSEPAVAIDGVFWLPPGVQKTVGINSLTANILCARHNSALSPFDTEAGQFLRTVKHIHASLDTSSLSRKRLISIVS